MSQSRCRSARPPNSCGPVRGRAGSTPYVPNDGHVPDDKAHRERSKSKSKNKIPKSMRYELENALLSLCDVWFQDIKPFLVENQIKLHVHSVPPAADGDRGDLSARCQHLHPGAAPDSGVVATASCVGCCLPLRTGSRPRSRRRRPAGTRPPHPPPQHPPPPQNRVKSRESVRRRALRPLRDYTAPRLCRTYSVLPSIRHEGRSEPGYRNKATGDKFAQPVKKLSTQKDKNPPHILHVKHKWTQTTFQYRQSTLRNQSRRRDYSPRLAMTSRATIQRNDTAREVTPLEVKARDVIPLDIKARDVIPLGIRARESRLRNRRSRASTTQLFPEELVDIIAKKSLVFLFRSPERAERPSFMNLVDPPTLGNQSQRKKVPWR